MTMALLKRLGSMLSLMSGCVGGLMALAAPARGQDGGDGLSVTGTVRLRYEAIGGQARTGFNQSDQLVNLRTTLKAEYSEGALRVGVELYDSRVWGEDAGSPVSTSEVNAIEPVQAYVAADFADAFGRGTMLTMTAGRMMLNLGSRRLVAADDYRNTTNGYTGLRADVVASRGWKATAIYVLPQQRRPDDREGLRETRVRLDREGFDLVLWGGQVSRARILGQATAELTYFHLGERDAPGRPTRDRSLDTLGGRVIREPHPDGIDYEVEALYQTGHASVSAAAAAARQRVSATFFHADMGYSFSGPWKPRLSVEFDRASGDRRGRRFGRFDTLFGMRRADLAPSGIYNSVGRANIMTAGIRLEAAPDKRLDWFAVYRPMWLAAKDDSFSSTNVRDSTGRSGRFAGHQIEARLRYWIVPARLRFEFDGVLLAKGRFLRDAPNAPPGNWTRYGSLNLSANF